MDDWGDPWADNAAKGAAQVAGKGLTGATILTGFGDEAHWGAEHEDTVWSTADTSAKEGAVDEKCEGSTSTQNAGDESHSEDVVGDNVAEHAVEENVRTSFEDRPLAEPHFSLAAAEQQPPAVDLDSSDSGTTIEPDHASRNLSNPIASPETTPESVRSGISTRPSTSLSESSHLDQSSESLRTSFEDDRKADQALDTSGDDVQSRVESTGDDAHNTNDDGDEFGDFEDEVLETEVVAQESAQSDSSGKHDVEQAVAVPISPKAASPVTDMGSEEQSSKDDMTGSRASFIPNGDLISEIFSAPGALNRDLEEPGDIISSTSTRKAWYRITRKETMREFESGNDVDNHVRIGWRGSRIRAESNKIVSRWASEDRNNGRVMLGGKPGAIFGWGNPTSTLSPSNAKHKRTATSATIGKAGKTVVDVADKARPQSLALTGVRRTSVIASNPIAQFNWSTSPTAEKIPLPASPVTISNMTSVQEVQSPKIPPAESITQRSVSPAISRLSRAPRPTSMILPNTTTRPALHARSSSGGGGIANLANTPTVDEIFASFESKWGLGSPTAAKNNVKETTSPPPSANLRPLPTAVETANPNSLGHQAPRPPHINTAVGVGTATDVSNEKVQDEDDEEFGEMVASPVVSAPPTVPAFSGSPHIPSQAPRIATFTHTPSPLNPLQSSRPPTPASAPGSSAPPLQTASDPWLSADFSVFDTPFSSSVAILPTVSLLHPTKRAFGHTRNSSLPSWPAAKPLAPAAFQKPAISHNRSQSLSGVADDAIVRQIVEGLPDLGYMLR